MRTSRSTQDAKGPLVGLLASGSRAFGLLPSRSTASGSAPSASPVTVAGAARVFHPLPVHERTVKERIGNADVRGDALALSRHDVARRQPDPPTRVPIEGGGVVRRHDDRRMAAARVSD